MYNDHCITEKAMSNIVEFQKAPSRLEAEDILKKLVTIGQVSLSAHCKQRMGERGITTQQVLTCLSKGRVIENPFLTNEQGGGYHVAVERTVAGDALRIVASIKFSQRILVITAIKYK
jgi:hypothetical protein